MSSDLLPSLPGYKAHPIRTNGAKKQYFMTLNGHKFVKDDCGDSPDCELSASASIATLGSSASAKFFPSSNVDSSVLNFTATVADVHDYSANPRSRRCSILYYVEDNTVKIVEHPQPNSASGTLLRRSVVVKENGSPLTLDDLQYGEDVVIYGRVYSIINCSDSTRTFLEDIGRTNLPPRKEDDDCSWKDDKTVEWGTFRREKNNLKVFMEAKLGNTVNNTGREGFNEYGNMVLKFLCIWDDSERLYGDVLEFVLVYHLADDTIEIFNNQSGGKELFPKLLKRAPLVKDYESTADGDEEQYYHWSDLYIGADINVYSRMLHIVEADSETRNFYDLMECPLGPSERSVAKSSRISFSRDIPPHNGFGSEEDSLKSCTGPLCPSTAPARSNVFENRILSFFARLLTKNSNDDKRRFVISFYMQDRTIKIHEPPVRNSGYVGGLFLSRRKVKRYGGSDYINEHDFEVGSTIRILTHEFYIEDANEFTLKW
eukprot:CAMPEP_0185024950 /NCGR_PEP_ID=MMETSP1103-20130426/8101_1 /TAXON_ID=36769 /ORGANISM="Paraphysomonas bandaiensis, Strain Caron Lab Isolate" /LENGTH=486 /DNA_ID=CAMNT_0027558049 /DNA_START=121 /DNA_END=1578 /DNA_ORIENTATION=+